MSSTPQSASQTTHDNVKAMEKPALAAIDSLQALLKAYQEMGTKSADRLTSSIKQLSAARTSAEFLELQQKLLSDGVAAAIHDGSAITTLTTNYFTSAFLPIQKQIEQNQPG